MKIFQCIDSIDKSHGGPSRSLPTMVIELSKLGVDCEIITYNSSNPNIELLNENNIDIKLLNREKNFFHRKFSSDYSLSLNTTDEAIVHCQHIWSMSMHRAIMEAHKKNIPYIVSPRGSLEPWSLKQNPIIKKIAWGLYQYNDLQQAACIHATAVSEAQHIRDLKISSPIAIIPNGINPDNYPLKEYRNKEINRVLFLSRLHPKKGLNILFEAWSKLPVELKENWILTIAGEGDTSYSINDLRQKLSLDYPDQNIEIIGPQYGMDKIKCYHSADIFILPSYSENFGMVVAEAMSCGVPVITTTGTPWHELQDNNIGWWVNPNVDNIMLALMQAMSMPIAELWEKGRKSRDFVLKNYSIRSLAVKYQTLYEWIINKNSTRKQPDFIFK